MTDSKSSSELMYEVLAAYQPGDEERLRSLIHPEGEIHGAPGLINAGTYHGYDGFREWLQSWDEAWEEINATFGWLYEWRDGLTTCFHVYPDVDSALEAAKRIAAEES